MGKATNFKFCMHIDSIDRNKSPKMFSKSSRAYSGTLEIIPGSGTHTQGASHGHL